MQLIVEEFIGFEVIAAEVMKYSAFWDVTLCLLLVHYSTFLLFAWFIFRS
jgi:hypothetical protein